MACSSLLASETALLLPGLLGQMPCRWSTSACSGVHQGTDELLFVLGDLSGGFVDSNPWISKAVAVMAKEVVPRGPLAPFGAFPQFQGSAFREPAVIPSASRPPLRATRRRTRGAEQDYLIQPCPSSLNSHVSSSSFVFAHHPLPSANPQPSRLPHYHPCASTLDHQPSTTHIHFTTMSNSETNQKASGRTEKWGLEAHVVLLKGLIAAIDEENMKPAKHKDLVLAVFAAEGLDGYTWEGIR